MTAQRTTYDPVAKTTHWVTAFLVLGLLVVGVTMGSIEQPELRAAFYTTHKTCGILVLLITLFRLVWRHKMPPPPLPVHLMPNWQVFAARWVHRGLYALLLLIPLSGWAMVSMGPYGIQLFGILPFPSLPLDAFSDSMSVRHAVKEMHEISATLIAGLVVIHIGATFLHHFVDRDDILMRISPACLTGWLNRIRGL